MAANLLELMAYTPFDPLLSSVVLSICSNRTQAF